MKKLPRAYNGDICTKCRNMLREGKTYAEAVKAHEDCHDWFHCNGCCGPCMICGSQGMTSLTMGE